MRSIKRFLTVGVITAVMIVAIFALTSAANAVKETASDMAAPVADAHIPGQFLTGANEGAPMDIALNYIRENAADLGLTQADVTSMAVSDMYTSQHNGVTHIYFQQQLNGIRVYNAYLNINIAADGSVINVGNRFVPDLANSILGDEAAVSPSEAVAAVAGELGLDLASTPQVIEVVGGVSEKVILDNAGISLDAIPVELMYQPADGGVYLAWDMVIYELSTEHWWSIRADAANGRILSQHDWVVNENAGHEGDVAHTHVSGGTHTGQATQGTSWSPAANSAPDEYYVFAYPLEDPDGGPPTVEVDPADPTSNPFGWHDTDDSPGPEHTITRGNNAWADSDLDANNIPDGNAPDGGAGLVFSDTYDLDMDPSTYLTSAIINLFYWNNIMHDISYRYGFDEPAGNFQENNYSNGGAGSDSVDAQAQDGSGTDNANFATPPDGSNPRMQMYRTTYPFGQAVTVTTPITLSDVYTANPSNNGGTANGLTADVELVVDGTAPNDDACQTVTNDLTGKIALIVWSAACNSSVFVQNAADAGALAAIIIDNTVLPLTNFGGSPSIPSVAVGSDDGQAFLTALNNHTLNVTIGDHPVPGVGRDTDLDNGVIAHEYGHGISNRLTGGPANVGCLGNQEQMGEGWSDLMTLFIHAAPGDVATDAREIGVWSLGAGFQGIRLFPYSTDMNVNPQTYDSIITNGTSPHSLGEVWAVMVWEVYWNLVDKHGFNADIYDDWTTGGNNLTFQLVMDGMKLQPCSPGMVDGRDAILAADMALTSGANQCEIWEGFAKRGLGYSADQGSPFSRTDGTEAFDLPPTCTSDVGVSGTESSDPVTVGSFLTYTLSLSNTGVESATNVILTDMLDVNTDYVSATPSTGSCSEAGGVVTCDLGTFFPSDTATVTVVVSATTVATVTNNVAIDMDQPDNIGNNSAVIETTVEPAAPSMWYVYMPSIHRP